MTDGNQTTGRKVLLPADKTELPISPQAFPISQMFAMSNWFLWRSLNYFCAPGRCSATPRKLTLTHTLIEIVLQSQDGGQKGPLEIFPCKPTAQSRVSQDIVQPVAGATCSLILDFSSLLCLSRQNLCAEIFVVRQLHNFPLLVHHQVVPLPNTE